MPPEAETFKEWRDRQTRQTLLLWMRGILTWQETSRKLCELSWTEQQAERLMAGAYLLLPVH